MQLSYATKNQKSFIISWAYPRKNMTCDAQEVYGGWKDAWASTAAEGLRFGTSKAGRNMSLRGSGPSGLPITTEWHDWYKHSVEKASKLYCDGNKTGTVLGILLKYCLYWRFLLCRSSLRKKAPKPWGQTVGFTRNRYKRDYKYSIPPPGIETRSSKLYPVVSLFQLPEVHQRDIQGVTYHTQFNSPTCMSRETY